MVSGYLVNIPFFSLSSLSVLDLCLSPLAGAALLNYSFSIFLASPIFLAVSSFSYAFNAVFTPFQFFFLGSPHSHSFNKYSLMEGILEPYLPFFYFQLPVRHFYIWVSLVPPISTFKTEIFLFLPPISVPPHEYFHASLKPISETQA